MDGWMEDGEMTNQSESTMVISVSVVYFYITSVHPRGNLTSREWSVSPFPSLRGWGFISKAMMNSQQTPTPYGPWVSMHLNEPSLPLPRTTQGFLNSLSLVKHYIKHNNNSHPSPPSSPSPPFSTSFFKSFSSLTFFFLVHITKDSFHLLFMMDSSTSFKAPYVISKFVAALNQTTKSRKPSFLTTLSLVSFLLPWFWTRRWEAASWWSEHQSCQSAPRLVHHSRGELQRYETCFLHDHCCLRHSTSATAIITMKTTRSYLVCPFKSSD